MVEVLEISAGKTFGQGKSLEEDHRTFVKAVKEDGCVSEEEEKTRWRQRIHVGTSAASTLFPLSCCSACLFSSPLALDKVMPYSQRSLWNTAPKPPQRETGTDREFIISPPRAVPDD